eukprot:g2869.t1
MDLLRSWRERGVDTDCLHTTSHTSKATEGGEGCSLVREALGKRAREALRGTSLRFAGQSPGGSETYKIDIPPAIACTLHPRAAQVSAELVRTLPQVLARTLGGATSHQALAPAHASTGAGSGAGTDTGRFAPDTRLETDAACFSEFFGSAARIGVQYAGLDAAQQKACQRLSQPPRAWDPAWSASERLRVAHEAGRGPLDGTDYLAGGHGEDADRADPMKIFTPCPHAWCKDRHPVGRAKALEASCLALHDYQAADAERLKADADAERSRQTVNVYHEQLEAVTRKHDAARDGRLTQERKRDTQLEIEGQHRRDEAEWKENYRANKQLRKELEAAIQDAAQKLAAALESVRERSEHADSRRLFVDGYEEEIKAAAAEMEEFKFRNVELARATKAKEEAETKLGPAREQLQQAQKSLDEAQGRVNGLETQLAKDRKALEDAIGRNPKRANKAAEKAKAKAAKHAGKAKVFQKEEEARAIDMRRIGGLEDTHAQRVADAERRVAVQCAEMQRLRPLVLEPHARRIDGYGHEGWGHTQRPPLPTAAALPERRVRRTSALHEGGGAGTNSAEGNATAIERGAMVQQYNFKEYFQGARRQKARVTQERSERCPYCGAVIERPPNMIAGHSVDIDFPYVIIDPAAHPCSKEMARDYASLGLGPGGTEPLDAAAAEALVKQKQEDEETEGGQRKHKHKHRHNADDAHANKSDGGSAKANKPRKRLLRIRVSPEMLAHWSGKLTAAQLKEEEFRLRQRLRREERDAPVVTVAAVTADGESGGDSNKEDAEKQQGQVAVGGAGREDDGDDGSGTDVDDDNDEEGKADDSDESSDDDYVRGGPACPVVVICRHEGCSQLLAREGPDTVAAADVAIHCEPIRLTATWKHEHRPKKVDKEQVRAASWQCKNCLTRNPETFQKCRECGQPHITEKERAAAADEEMQKLREIAEAAQRELHETPQERAAREARLRRDKRKAKAEAKRQRQAERMGKRNRKREKHVHVEGTQYLDGRHEHEDGGGCPLVRLQRATSIRDRKQLRRWTNAQHERVALRQRERALAPLLRSGDHVFVRSERAGEPGPLRGTVLLQWELAVIAEGGAPRWAARGDVVGPSPISNRGIHVREARTAKVIEVHFFERTKDLSVYSARTGEVTPLARHTVFLRDVIPPVAFPLVESKDIVLGQDARAFMVPKALRDAAEATIEEDKTFGIRLADDELLHDRYMPRLDLSIHADRMAGQQLEFEGGKHAMRRRKPPKPEALSDDGEGTAKAPTYTPDELIGMLTALNPGKYETSPDTLDERGAPTLMKNGRQLSAIQQAELEISIADAEKQLNNRSPEKRKLSQAVVW